MFGAINEETPSYDILAKKDGYEIRRYHQLYLAQSTYNVPTNTDFSSKSGIGFSPLYRFISGNNSTQTKIAMTVPVIMQEIENNQGLERKMSFIMSPSKFHSLDQLPKANDDNIQMIEQSNTRDMVCITFNMSMSTGKNAIKEKELREATARDGIQLSTNRNDTLYFAYNSPFTVPYFRKNEICIPIISQ